MRDNILRYLRENELIAPGATLVCAVSGGKDSVCLLHVMLSLQKELSITVEAAHLNHQLRGPIERIFEGVLADSTLKGLFQGDHMNVKKVVTSQNTGIGRFVSKQNTCLKCKCPLKTGAVCQNCKQYESQYYIQTAMQVELQERQYCELWTTCQRCQNSLHQEIICGNKDCPIYYQREKIKKDLQTSIAKLKRFSE